MNNSTETRNSNPYAYVCVGGTALGRPTEFEVHALDCRDVPKLARAGAHVHPHRASSPEEVVDESVSDYEYQDQGWTHDDHRIMPCARSTR